MVVIWVLDCWLLFLIFSALLCLCECGDKRPAISQNTPQNNNKKKSPTKILRFYWVQPSWGKENPPWAEKRPGESVLGEHICTVLLMGKATRKAEPQLRGHKETCLWRNEENPTAPLQLKVYLPSPDLSVRSCMTREQGRRGAPATAPALGIRHLPGDWTTRQGPAMGLQVVPLGRGSEPICALGALMVLPSIAI